MPDNRSYYGGAAADTAHCRTRKSDRYVGAQNLAPLERSRTKFAHVGYNYV
jgi:hypothetical protein